MSHTDLGCEPAEGGLGTGDNGDPCSPTDGFLVGVSRGSEEKPSMTVSAFTVQSSSSTPPAFSLSNQEVTCQN